MPCPICRSLPAILAVISLAAVACSSSSQPDSDASSSYATETCSLDKAEQLEQAMWNAYGALVEEGCVSDPDGPGCAAVLSQFDADAVAFFECSGKLQYQPLCEAIERAQTRWSNERAAYCEPPAAEHRAYCDAIAYFGSWATDKIPFVCEPWPDSGPCSADRRKERIAEEQTVVENMLAHGCLPYAEQPSEACHKARDGWAALKDVNAKCNAERNGDKLCDYYERKQLKAEAGLKSACSPASDEAKAPAPFDGWPSYCGYLELHRDHYAELLEGCE